MKIGKQKSYSSLISKKRNSCPKMHNQSINNKHIQSNTKKIRSNSSIANKKTSIIKSEQDFMNPQFHSKNRFSKTPVLVIDNNIQTTPILRQQVYNSKQTRRDKFRKQKKKSLNNNAIQKENPQNKNTQDESINNIKRSDLIKNQIKSKLQENNIKESNDILKKNSLKTDFMCIVETAFKIINIFNNNQVVVNKSTWINDQLLYFFGPLFHKLKNNNQKINFYQFFLQVQKIYQDSSFPDIEKCLQILQNIIKTQKQKMIDRLNNGYDRGCQSIQQKINSNNPPSRYRYQSIPQKQLKPILKKSSIYNPMSPPQEIKKQSIKIVIKEQIKQEDKKYNSIKSPLINEDKSSINTKYTQNYTKQVFQIHKPKFQYLQNMQLKHSCNFETSPPPTESKIQKNIKLNISTKEPQNSRSDFYDNAYDKSKRSALPQELHPNNINKSAITTKQELKPFSYNNNQSDQNKLSMLSKKLEFFIQRNTEHLQISKNVRLENGYTDQ